MQRRTVWLAFLMLPLLWWLPVPAAHAVAASPCAHAGAMMPATDQAAHHHGPRGQGVCGIDCPMHCGGLVAAAEPPAVRRAASAHRFAPSPVLAVVCWDPGAPHGPPRPAI